MTAIITRTELDRIGVTRSVLSGALSCCLLRVRKGMYVVLGDCRQDAHAAIAEFGIGRKDDPGNLADHAQSGRSRTGQWGTLHTWNESHRGYGRAPDLEQQIAADLEAVHAPGLRGHAAKLRILARTYASGLSDDSALSHVSAALLWGLPLTRPAQKRVEAVRRGRSRTYAKCVVRQRSLTDEDVTAIGGIPITTVARTLLDVALDYPLDVSVPMIDHALRSRLVTLDKLATLTSAVDDRRGAVRARTAFGLAEPLHESPAESICGVRFHEHAIVGFEPQITFRMPEDEGFARVDFLHRESAVIVEVNGEIKYIDGDAGALRAKRERHRDYQLRGLGYRVYQLMWSDLFQPRAFRRIKQAVEHPDRRSGS